MKSGAEVELSVQLTVPLNQSPVGDRSKANGQHPLDLILGYVLVQYLVYTKS